MSSEVPKGPLGRVAARSASRSMRRLATSGVALAAAGAVALATAASSGANAVHPRAAHAKSSASKFGTVIKGSFPSPGRAANGGTITMAQITGTTPTYIFPIVPGADSSTATFAFIQQMWVPLYYGPTGAKPVINYQLSLAAGPPKASNHDKTFTIHLKRGLKWSDGQPVDSQDVAFYIAILQAGLKASPANWGQYVPGQFPLDVKSVKTPNATTVVINLNKGYNPAFFMNNQLQDTNGGVIPLPHNAWNVSSAGGAHITDWATNPKDAAAIYSYLNTQGSSLSTWATNPLWQVVDGPYRLSAFSTTNSSYTQVPNPKYSLPLKAHATIQMNTYTGETAELNALETGSLDIANPPAGIDASTQLKAIPGLRSRGYSVFGGPSWGWFGGIINFQDKTANWDKVIAQPYMRAVFAELINQPAIIKGVYHGWAVPAYGPVPTAPFSPYAPKSVAAPYPYSPTRAAATLKAHGWKVVPGGTTRCVKPGAGSGHCGAGIPKGNPISLVWANLPYTTQASGFLESEALQSAAKKFAGIKVTLTSKSFNFLTSNYNLQNPAAKKFVNDWAVNNFGGIFMDYYPTQNGIENPGAGFNMGSFNDPVANRLMNASVFSANVNAIKNEAGYLTKNFPVFYLPDNDQIAAVSNKVGGSANAFLSLTQQTWANNLFYLKK